MRFESQKAERAKYVALEGEAVEKGAILWDKIRMIVRLGGNAKFSRQPRKVINGENVASSSFLCRRFLVCQDDK